MAKEKEPQNDKAGGALYQTLGDQLVGRIRAGIYPVGSNLPTELELCEEFSVSRHTVREAVRRLQETGLIERRRRIGTTVLKKQPEPQFGLELETTDQLQHYLQTTDLHVARVIDDLAKQPDEVRLEKDPHAWIKVETYRCAPGTKRPISWTDIYIRREYRKVAANIANARRGVYPLFEDLYGEVVETIAIEISAAIFPPRVARPLGYGKGEPALLMIRRFYNRDNKLLEVAVSYYPPYEFRYLARLKRDQGRHQTRPAK